MLPVLDAALASAGVAFQETGAESPARRCYREVLERNPEHFRVLNNLAELLLSHPSTAAEAVTMAERAAEIEPEIPEVWDTVGRAKLSAGDPTGAAGAWGRAAEGLRARIAVGEKALSSVGNARLLALAELGIARARLILEEPERARAALERAVRADPEIESDPDYAAARDALR
jgi:Tfp pilus assembly protein PilF